MTGALAACGGSGRPPAPPGTAAPDAAASGPATAAAVPPDEATAGSTAAAAEPALVAASRVPQGGGVVLPDHKIVVTQPAAGQYRAFSAVCTHQGCLVAEVSRAGIVCYCHGSRYSIADGSVTNPPAEKPLAPVAVTVRDGSVVRG